MSVKQTFVLSVVGGLASVGAQAQTILHSFSAAPDGAYVTSSPLFVPGSPDNFLYGTSEFGGDKNNGTVWKYDLSTHTESVVYSFGKFGARDGSRPVTALIQNGPYLYGATLSGAIYRIEIATGAEKVLYQFSGPVLPEIVDKLLYKGGKLYGVDSGGSSGLGTVFQCTLSGDCTTLYSFAGGSDGATPSGGLLYKVVSVNGVEQPALFGVTSAGGAANLGTVYMLPLSGSADTVLHSFTGGSDGAGPESAMEAYGANLVGVTAYGGGTSCSDSGGNGCGTVFSISPAGSNYKVVHAFHGFSGPPQFDGSYPLGDVTVLGDVLYGTTFFGGKTNASPCTEGCGTVYKLNLSNSSEAVLANFKGKASSDFPLGLISNAGIFYGTTNGYAPRPRKLDSPSILYSFP